MHAQLMRGFLVTTLLGCSSSPESAPAEGTPRIPQATTAKHEAPAALRGCAERTGGTESITGFVDHTNQLPSPVDVPCVVASLPRPLAIAATSNKASAQPAASAVSPRIFLLFGKLVVSVVPEGKGAPFIELAEWVTPGRTMKGELQFPLSAPVATDTPFRRIEQANQSTMCGVCHREESPHETIPHAYVSAAFRPNTGLVELAALEAEHGKCAESADASPRCALFHAIFDFGAVSAGEFPSGTETFF